MIGRGRRQSEAVVSPISIGETRVRAVTDPPARTTPADRAGTGGRPLAVDDRSDGGGPPAFDDDPVAVAWRALGCVYDPELCIDVVTLGLVYDVRLEPPEVVVEMTLTTPGCPASESLPDMARASVAAALGGTRPVTVEVVWDPPWDPAMMDQDAAAFGLRSP